MTGPETDDKTAGAAHDPARGSDVAPHKTGANNNKKEEYAVDVRGLNKSFGAKPAVRDLSLKVRRGEIFGFLGPNGSGKTTSIRMMCGLLTPDSGSGTCLGFDIIRQRIEIKRRAGYMTQRFSFWEDLSIRENLDFVARLYGMSRRREAVDKCLENLGLSSRSKQLAGALSGGWKQRLALAACMLHQPELLLLDEPTAGVDPKARREFWEEIHRLAAQGISVLVSTHYMDEAERCHKLAYIAYGELLAHGAAAEIVAGQGLHTFEINCEAQNAEDACTSVDIARLGQELNRGLNRGLNWQLGKELNREPQNTAGPGAEQGAKQGAEQVVAFGNSLHISGNNADKIKAAIDEALKRAGGARQYKIREIPASLEDVFISLMTRAERAGQGAGSGPAAAREQPTAQAGKGR